MVMRRKKPFLLLTNPHLRQQMGRSASARAKELFAEDEVMNQYQELFADLEQRRLAAPPESRRGRPLPASLDPVQAFQAYPSHPSHSYEREEFPLDKTENLPGVLCDARSMLWHLLEETVPVHLKGDLHRDLLRKAFLLFHEAISCHHKVAPLVHHQPLAAMVCFQQFVVCLIWASLFGY